MKLSPHAIFSLSQALNHLREAAEFTEHPLIGFILLVVTLATAATFVVPVVLWLFGMLIAASAVDKHNQSVDDFLQVMKAR